MSPASLHEVAVQGVERVAAQISSKTSVKDSAGALIDGLEGLFRDAGYEPQPHTALLSALQANRQLLIDSVSSNTGPGGYDPTTEAGASGSAPDANPNAQSSAPPSAADLDANAKEVEAKNKTKSPDTKGKKANTI